MASLASVEDLELRLGRSFTPEEILRAQAILDDVSAHVRDLTGQSFDDEVPAVVLAVVAQVAGRNFGTPADRSGISQESAGPFSYTVGSAAASGMFLPAELDVLRRFRCGADGSVRTIKIRPAMGW